MRAVARCSGRLSPYRTGGSTMTARGQSYRMIPLTKGLFAIVDAADFEWLNQWKWRASKNNSSGYYYAVRTEGPRGRVTFFSMHRVILGLSHGDPRLGDHRVTGSTLDNRRSNIRISSQAQNQMNRSKTKSNTSGFKGVTWAKDKNKWQASITVGGKHKFIGRYPTPEEAHAAYCDAAKQYHGEFART